MGKIYEYHYRVRTGHGKPEKSWNLFFQFPGLESDEKEICLRKIKRQKVKKEN